MLLKPENSDFLNPNNGCSLTIEQRLCELLKSKHFPITIQFDNENDIQEFTDAVLTSKKY
jgi:hypothetical protein